MSWRAHVLMIAAALTVAVGFALAADDATVKLECTSVVTAQCPSGTSSGVVLISARDTIAAPPTTKSTLTFGSVDDSFKEAMAFRRGSAPAYKHVTWTTAETLAFTDRVELPLRIWAVCTDDAGTCPALTSTRRTQLEKIVTHANGKLNGERVGIMLVPANGTLISDESGTGDLTELKDVDDCAAFKEKAAMLSPARVVTTALNIYVVHTVRVRGEAGPGFGQDCSDRTKKVAVVGRKASWRTVLHEIGHMLALEHVEETASNWGSDPKENFMRDFSATRKFFTEGQIFRVHLGQRSALNDLLNRYPTDKRFCDPSTAALPCPKPNERVWDEP